MTDLAALMMSAARLDAPAVERLKALGISGSAISTVTLATGHPAIGLLDAEDAGVGLFAPGPGPRHLVQPVVVDGAIVDIVATRSLRPDAWRLLRGIGWALGEDLITAERSWPTGEPLTVWRTPLDWLRAGGSGLCIVDWAAEGVRSLIDVEAIRVPDQALGDLLVQTMSKPPRLPRMIVEGRHGKRAG